MFGMFDVEHCRKLYGERAPAKAGGWDDYFSRVLDVRSPEFSTRRSRRIQQEQHKAAQIETPDVAKRKAGHPQNESEHAQQLAQSVQEEVARSPTRHRYGVGGSFLEQPFGRQDQRPTDHHRRTDDTNRNKRESVEQSIRRIVSEFSGEPLSRHRVQRDAGQHGDLNLAPQPYRGSDYHKFRV